MASVHDGHRERMKSKLLRTSIDSFEPHEVLEMLLFYALPRRDVNALAHELINTFGSFDRVLEADPAELRKVKGVGDHVIALFKLILGSYKTYEQQRGSSRIHINSPEAVMPYVQSLYIGETVEKCYLLCFDSKLSLVACDLVSQGSGHGTGILLQRVMELVMRHRASSVILAHNHPGGNLMPSAEDIEATRHILHVLHPIGIELSDHIIVAGDKCLSFAQSGVLASMRERLHEKP